MAYSVGVDVGGTFTDVVLVNEADSSMHIAKVASTAPDPSAGMMNGILRVCDRAAIKPEHITKCMHGTTVATNAVLTDQGARVGLIVTRGYRSVLQIARSFIPGGLGAWVNFNKSAPLAPLALTLEADERISARGEVIEPLDEAKLRGSLRQLREQNIQALTICFLHAYVNDSHERLAGRIAEEELPGVLVSLSSEVIPEMQEYERALTTVCNSYVRPIVSRYIASIERELETHSGEVSLSILRSDGGLTSAKGACRAPVNLLMSGPAGGVTGANWVARQAGYKNLLTLDMGGTSTDVCLVKDGVAQVRRETTVGDLTVRAASIDTRTVGAGGGSIAHVPELTKALRVGPQSAGSTPGPAGYAKGGTEPTVTDANIVLGYLPRSALLGGDMKIDHGLACAAVERIADAIKLPVERAAAGIYDIANERMMGALRLVSVQQGYDPRQFALFAFGGAGPLHANALAKLLGSWPVIVPPGPGVLCALGDVTTRMRNEASRSVMRRFSELSWANLRVVLTDLAEGAAARLHAEGVPREEQEVGYEMDVRYAGQVLHQTLSICLDDVDRQGLGSIGAKFDEKHAQLYTFALDVDYELINVRAIVKGKQSRVHANRLKRRQGDLDEAILDHQGAYFGDRFVQTPIYDRARLLTGDRLSGPAIVTQLDSTTLVQPDHSAEVDEIGNLVIRPNAM